MSVDLVVVLVVALVATVSLLAAVVAAVLDWFRHHDGVGAVVAGGRAFVMVVLVALGVVAAARGL